MEDELTAKMHSEFRVSKETDIRHRAGCLWAVLHDIGKTDDKEQILYEAKMYGITYDQAMMWKDYWLKDMLYGRNAE